MSDDFAEIKVSGGRVAKVSLRDAVHVRPFTWGVTRQASGWDKTIYATNHRVGLMHRYILRVQPGQIVDHINGDGLDNRRENLRIATHSQNARNNEPNNPHRESQFKGVYWMPRFQKWGAMLVINGSEVRLGRFDAEEDAARAFDVAVLARDGEYARTNADLGLYGIDRSAYRAEKIRKRAW